MHFFERMASLSWLDCNLFLQFIFKKKTLHPQFRDTVGNVLLSLQFFNSNSYKKRVQLADFPRY